MVLSDTREIESSSEIKNKQILEINIYVIKVFTKQLNVKNNIGIIIIVLLLLCNIILTGTILWYILDSEWNELLIAFIIIYFFLFLFLWTLFQVVRAV